MKFTSISMLTAVAILQVTSAFATEKPLHFVQHNFVANKAIYKPDVIEKDFVNGCASPSTPKSFAGHSLLQFRAKGAGKSGGGP